ncbi:alginate lyase precursor [Psychromonas sp. RZ22]|uniref:polysaccharide lyase 6 family protein n=1 Tax=Psychromonas algarum TaxID=2555643 RepID=UPI001067CE3C|nr:polysaccharide lyase 6 family protein [Psychromonas sp. RZ22]TEW55367.1 alginate lyase precursor [Psychromonas sp. RZ22]
MYKKLILASMIAGLMGCGGSNDSSVPTPGVPDTEVPDTEVPDTGAPDTEVPDIELDIPNLPAGVKTVPEVNCTEVFTSVSVLEDAVSEEMEAGTTLCLADGTYSDDLQLKMGGAGTEAQPIKVAAENPGKAIFEGGKISIKMGGTYTQLQGLVFKDITFSSALIETRLGSNLEDLCHNCRITEVTVDTAEATGSGGILAKIFGKDIWVDHNIFSGKTAANPMVSLDRWLSGDLVTDEEKLPMLTQGVVVYNNYFANRPPADGKMYAGSSDNDYEAIRTGLSDTHHYPGNSFVVGNLFENIQGEAEVVSNKASNNVISHNTVRNSYGSITNRHGNTNVIDGNFVFGDGYPFAGGLRIVDDGHIVTNNYIEGARYKATTHHGGIVILGSDGAGDGNNGYQQVENIHVAHNTVVNSVNSVNIDGGGKSDQPKQVYFANNIVDQAVGPIFVQTDRSVSNDSVYTGNHVYGSELADTSSITDSDLGATLETSPMLAATNGIYRPISPSSLIAGSYDKGDFDSVTMDMDGTERGEVTQVGADDDNSNVATSKPLTYADVGPSYDYPKPEAIMVEAEISNADFEDDATGWSGASVTTDGAFAGHSLVIQGTNDVTQSNVELTPSTRYAVSAFVKGVYSISVNDHVFEGEESTSDYTYVIHEFTTGSAETSGEIKLALAKEVVLNAELVDGDLSGFRGGDTGNWETDEDSDAGLGDVGSSGDSAFNDVDSNGSVRIRFKKGQTNHDFTATPGLRQTVHNIPTATDLTYSLYYCDNKKEDSVTTLHYGVKDTEGLVIAESTAHVKDLDDAPEGSVKDCFKQVTLDIPNNSHETMEIFAYITVDTANYSNEELLAQVESNKELEVRVDEFSLTYTGAPASDAEAHFDEVRLVKRVD